MEKKNDDGIDFNDVRKYGKVTGVNVAGKKKAVAMMAVLDGVVAHYTEAKESLSNEDFEEYKKENNDMLDWFNKHKEFDPEEQKPAEEPAEDQVEPEQEEAEPDTVEEDSVAAEDAEKVAEEETKKRLEEAKAKADAEKAKKGKDKGKAKDLAKAKDRIKDAKAKAKEKKAESEKKKAEAKVSGESSAPYISRFRKMLENPNTLPSKIREYIKEKGEITYGDLRKACVSKLGCKSETSGPIGASVKVLEMDGLVRFEGKGSSKRIIVV